jgi:hypothetical protein
LGDDNVLQRFDAKELRTDFGGEQNISISRADPFSTRFWRLPQAMATAP